MVKAQGFRGLGVVRRAVVGTALAALLAGCGGETDSDGPLGAVALTIVTVPEDALCLKVKVVGDREVLKSFALTPGSSAVFNVTGLGPGPVTITEEAFNLACANVKANSAPTWLSAAPTPATILADQTTTVMVTMQPTGVLKIRNDFNDAAFVVSPAAADFGPASVGSTGQQLTFTLTNIGRVGLGPFATSVAGQDPGDFVVTRAPCANLAKGASCTMTVVFRPQNAGQRVASLLISETPGGMTTVRLTGTGALPATLVLSPAFHDFGRVPRGTNAGPALFTLRNIGDTPTPPLGLRLSSTSSNGLAFHWTAETCANVSLGADATCDIAIVAFPIDAPGGVHTADLVFSTPSGLFASAQLRVTSQ